ncbi:MAG: hypothetical protein K2Y32_17130 [Candidatus Obscuribacterales bacterium]|nr:hypothetical protein [Candidatus Obscuribacterales bacterium]
MPRAALAVIVVGIIWQLLLVYFDLGLDLLNLPNWLNRLIQLTTAFLLYSWSAVCFCIGLSAGSRVNQGRDFCKHSWALAQAYLYLRETIQLAAHLLERASGASAPSSSLTLGLRYLALALFAYQVIFKMGSPTLVAHLSGLTLGYLCAGFIEKFKGWKAGIQKKENENVSETS